MFLSVIYQFDVAEATKTKDLKFKSHKSKKDAILDSLYDLIIYFEHNLDIYNDLQSLPENLKANEDGIIYAKDMISKISNFITCIKLDIERQIPYYFVDENGYGITFSIKEIQNSGEVVDTLDEFDFYTV